MLVYAVTNEKLVGLPTPDGWDVVLVPSDTSDKAYRVDITHGRCDCPKWKFQRGFKMPCKHLKDLGFKPVPVPFEIAEPQKTKKGVKLKVHK
jgi:hypothetical protein